MLILTEWQEGLEQNQLYPFPPSTLRTFFNNQETKKMLASSSVKNRRVLGLSGIDPIGHDVPMYQVPWQVFSDLDWSVTGTPVLFALHEDQLWLWPTPEGPGSYFSATVGGETEK